MVPEQKEPIVVPLSDGEEIVFRHIPAGSFRMGLRGVVEPVTEVTVEEFWMAETPATWKQLFFLVKWSLEKTPIARCSEEILRSEIPDLFGGLNGVMDLMSSVQYAPLNILSDSPVTYFTMSEILSLAALLTRRIIVDDELSSNLLVCLPSEEEWEYAAKGGSETEFVGGDGRESFLVSACIPGRERIFRRAFYAPPLRRNIKNAWGLYALHGHVGEWCCGSILNDVHRLQVPSCTRSLGNYREGGGVGVIKGCSWDTQYRRGRLASRSGGYQEDRDRAFGFRFILREGKKDELFERFFEFLDEFEADEKIDRLVTTAASLHQKNDLPEAVKIYDEIIDSKDCSRLRRGLAYNNRGWTFYLLRDFERFSSDCENAVSIDPNQVSYSLNLALAHLALEQVGLAKKILEKVMPSVDGSILDAFLMDLEEASADWLDKEILEDFLSAGGISI